MFHPFCKCSTAAHMDRREVESAIAELEKAEGVSPEKRLKNIMESVARNFDSFSRNNIPPNFKNKATPIDIAIRRLRADTGIKYEKVRAEKFKNSWQQYRLEDALVDMGGDLNTAQMNESGSKVIIPTSQLHKVIVYSPSGEYFRIWDDRFEKTDRNSNSYYDINGLSGNEFIAQIKEELNKSGRVAEPKLLDQIIKERTHFKNE